MTVIWHTEELLIKFRIRVWLEFGSESSKGLSTQDTKPILDLFLKKSICSFTY